MYETYIRRLSLLLAFFVTVVSCTGLFVSGFYAKETLNWQVQTYGQDLVDLFIVTPVLLLSTLWVRKKSVPAMSIWAGVSLYLLYTFVIYCFDIHFNRLFLLYCFALGLSFYLFLYFLYHQTKLSPIHFVNRPRIIKITGYYFIATAVLFYLLWLADIVPAISTNTIPHDLETTGLITNPVHVIDLSIFLPGVFIAGLLLLAKKNMGYWLAPAILVFFILMDITIGLLAILMYVNNISANYSVAIVMFILSIISGIILFAYLGKVNKTS